MLPVPPPQGRQVLVRMLASAFNHREIFARQSLYPGLKFGVPLCCDGCGVVVAVGDDVASSTSRNLLNKRVIINPGTGWDCHPDAPESEGGYVTLGMSAAGTGTLQEYMLVDERDAFLAPEHLSDVEAAALPAAGLTAWRGLMVQSGNAVPGRNILVTGIGGGVALMALRFALAAGCNVYVTSSSADKLRRAVAMGAKAGVNYKDADWDRKLLDLLPPERPFIDAIVDSAGGDIVSRGVRCLKRAGVIVLAGMTLGPMTPYPMKAVFRQITLIPGTMGSRKDFGDMMDCVRANAIKPPVWKSISGIDDVERIDQFMTEFAAGGQFGKLVIEIADRNKKESRL